MFDLELMMIAALVAAAMIGAIVFVVRDRRSRKMDAHAMSVMDRCRDG